MATDESKTLRNLVNASGFPFQLGVEHQVRASAGNHNWRIVAREHPWRDPESGDEGFIDLIIRSSSVIWALECKRPKGGEWAFLVPQDQPPDTNRVRCLWAARSPDVTKVAGWDDVRITPKSPESSFCAIRGMGESDKPLLERVSAYLSKSLDCLADEDLGMIKPQTTDDFRIYMPVIVTTARLRVCRVRPETVSMTDGQVQDAIFETVPMVRFRKAFSSRLPPSSSPRDLESATTEKERTVLVVNATEFSNVLTQTKFHINAAFGEKWPWQIALEQARQKAKR